MNTKLQAICGSRGKSLNLFVPAGQASDDTGARAQSDSSRYADWLLGEPKFFGHRHAGHAPFPCS